MKIYDCFQFFNELDLLEIRLNILNDYVDYFVLVESTVTFYGFDKPLFYKENKDKFTKNLLKVMGFEDTETKFLMALVGPKQVKAGKSQIIDKHPSLDLSDIDIVNEPGKISVKIINNRTNKVLINFTAKEGGTFAGFVDALS